MDEGRESSVASSTDFYGPPDDKPSPPREHDPALNGTGAIKRKASELASVHEKKARRHSLSPSRSPAPKPCAGLPAALWQHIFLSCSLADLGRLLQVNRSFHSYLTDVPHATSAKPVSGCLRLLKSESIWASARNALPVKPPKPLPGLSELQMWQLAWSKRCQFCNLLGSGVPGEKIWQQGPGATRVRIIWPFAIRACGPCLMQRCQTDASLLFSNASALRPALPFAFITNDQHYVPAYTLQAATTPASVEIAKYYSKKHVEDITKELDSALGLGNAAAEEWSKGLSARGQECMKMAENWERWEVKYQWWSDHQAPKPDASLPCSPAPAPRKDPLKSPTRHAPSPVIHAPVPASKYPSAVSSATSNGGLFLRPSPPPVPSLTAAAPPAPPPCYMQARPATNPTQGFTPQPGANGSAQSAHRNLHDANEAKASRKADIERRCQAMNPPIPPNVLRHMDSFKAAIQIPQPMSDYAWSVLKPRLLAHLSSAQQAEADHVSRVTSLPSRTAERRHLDPNCKEAKEAMDREWDESQRPVRDKLSAIANDFINRDWDHGDALTYENSPKFAVDLLMYVRRTFYAEHADAEDAPGPAQQEPDAAEEGAGKPKLVLDNMKWVYDNKVKPLTEQFRKELFICHGNGCETNTRYYGFEGVIQHFGAKHTNAFSVGNVVVAWREAEWPEDTPFHPDPISVKHAYHAASNSAGNNYGSYYGGYSRAGTTTPHMQSHLPQASPGPYHYGGHYNGPFAPPHAGSATVPGYDYSQYTASADPYAAYSSMGPPGYGHQPSAHAYMTSPAMIAPAVAPPPPGPSAAPGTQDASHAQPEDADHSTNLFDKQVSTIIEMAQDIWKQFSGIKDLPNSLRIYVLLQRVISKFHMGFNHEPHLDHFTDALSNHEIPKALKNAPGLSCKACQDQSAQQNSAFCAQYSRLEERKTYTVLNLFSHFKAQHTGYQPAAYGMGQPANLDWKEDMIELPSDRIISGLIHAPGMDDDKLLMIATVFPKLFPTPLPKIGVVDDNGVPSRLNSAPKDTRDSKDPKDGPSTGDTPGVSADKSGPSSLASPYHDSPRPLKPSDDEYDPQRPGLPNQANQSSRPVNRKQSYRATSPDRRQRHHAEPRYFLPREPMDDDYPTRRDYYGYAPSPMRFRETGSAFEEYPARRPLYREQEAYYGPPSNELIYTRPREDIHMQEYGAYPRQVRYYEEDERRAGHRFVREPRSRERSDARNQNAADRLLEETIPGQPKVLEESATQETAPSVPPKPPTVESEADDGSRYTPPPPNVPSALGQPAEPSSHKAPSTVSNGSRYDDYPSAGRFGPPPDAVGPYRRSAPHRPGPHRRRDRYHDHIPSSRYYRYMSVAREEPYGRGASMSRAQSRRYEEQRRRIDQQETPQPNAERDQEPTFSRDPSVDPHPADDGFYAPARHAPREYVPLQERHRPYSPARYRYAAYEEEPRGPPPVYVDEYGYEVIRVPREHRPMRTYPNPPRFVEHEPEHYQYVPMTYERPAPHRYEAPPADYVYYERERAPPISARRSAFEAETEPYEPPPPEVKVENPPTPVVPE